MSANTRRIISVGYVGTHRWVKAHLDDSLADATTTSDPSTCGALLSYQHYRDQETGFSRSLARSLKG